MNNAEATDTPATIPRSLEESKAFQDTAHTHSEISARKDRGTDDPLPDEGYRNLARDIKPQCAGPAPLTGFPAKTIMILLTATVEAFEKRGNVHRNISMNNIILDPNMNSEKFKRWLTVLKTKDAKDIEEVPSFVPSTGLLCDWELAVNHCDHNKLVCI